MAEVVERVAAPRGIGRVPGPMRAAWVIIEGYWTWYRRGWRATAVSSIVQPLLFLVALGLGFGSQVQPGAATGGLRYLVYLTPALLMTTAVQIGSFAGEKHASEVADHLQRRYRTAKVLRFASPVGDWWVRVRVLDDDRQRAQTLARETQTPEGSVFLVRLD